MNRLKYQIEQEKYLVKLEKILYIDTTYLQKFKFNTREVFNQLFLNREKKSRGHLYRTEI